MAYTPVIAKEAPSHAARAAIRYRETRDGCLSYVKAGLDLFRLKCRLRGSILAGPGLSHFAIQWLIFERVAI
jgi:hypothetical protein